LGDIREGRTTKQFNNFNQLGAYANIVAQNMNGKNFCCKV